MMANIRTLNTMFRVHNMRSQYFFTFKQKLSFKITYILSNETPRTPLNTAPLYLNGIFFPPEAPNNYNV